jgi:hypothetical protein
MTIGKCYGGPLNGTERRERAESFVYNTAGPRPAMVVGFEPAPVDFNIQIVQHRYKVSAAICRATTTRGVSVERLLYLWIHEDYKLTTRDRSIIITDLYEVAWERIPTYQDTVGMDYDQYKLWQEETMHFAYYVRVGRVQVVDVSHLPAFPEDFFKGL